ncbi:MAG TPA: hypothetical protein VFA99_14145 [Acidobacteriaceae bacterium]|nr:hypothetical protein [Acidobacteriaceae bacterium]
MTRLRHRRVLFFFLSFVSLSAGATLLAFIPNLMPFPDKTGAVATYIPAGAIDEQNPFFQSLGTNGRTCATCHQPDQAFSLSATGARRVYDRTHGNDPLFAAVDGANCPTNTSGDPSAHSLLLSNGLIRVGLTPPSNAQFTISVVHDPYGCAITYDPNTGAPIISVYRRPIPATNLRFLSAVMFDGRETLLPLNDTNSFETNLAYDLTDQAKSAVMGHAQGAVAPSAQQLAEIVQFESGLSTAQTFDNQAGSLSAGSVSGGPQAISSQKYSPGMNDPLAGNPLGASFNQNAFSLYTAWENLPAQPGFPWSLPSPAAARNERKREIAAGEKIFNTQPLIITGVRGLNDNASIGSPASITGTCTTCHNTPNIGNHSVALPLDIGTSRQPGYETNPAIIAALQQLSTPDLPVYEIRGCPDPQNPGMTLTFYTSDPGKALISGLCSDVNRGKGPILRGLAARAPYFHNGSAADLQQLVRFYDQRFQMNLTAEQQKDLVAFLNSL